MPKLTKTFIESLEPQSESVIYWDSLIFGFGVRVSPKGKKAYLVRYRTINRKQRKPVIGIHGVMTCEQAREAAKTILSGVNLGKDFQGEKEKIRNEPTLNEFFKMYIDKYAKQHKKTWKFNEEYYNRHIKNAFGDYRLSTITQDDILKIHKKIGANSGHSMANQIVTLIGMIFNKAIEWDYYEHKNPILHIKKFKEKSRDRFLQSNELPAFLSAVDMEEQPFRDFFYILLLTGQRKTNVLEMKWQDINLKEKYWRIPETKNGDPLMVPLVNDALTILKQRKKESNGSSEWVFTSKTSRSGRLTDPKRAWYRVLRECELKDLRMHDLRRTMGSYQTILGASSFIVAKSLGHKDQKSTQIYARLNMDPVRQSMQKASTVMLNMENENDE